MAIAGLKPLARRMSGNRFALFALAGFIGGALGAALSEPFFRAEPRSYAALIRGVALWAGFICVFISIALTWASEWYRRQPKLDPRVALQAGAWGLVGGVVGGAVAQVVYSAIGAGGSLLNEFLIRPIAWSIMGAVVGLSLAQALPNLARSKAAIGGAIGGMVGSWAFTLISAAVAEAVGRSIGMGAVGAGIGLAVLVVESLTREGYLEVTWAPSEVTVVSLGPTPVTLGGSPGDDIYVSGLPQSAASVVLRDGRVSYIDGATEKSTELRDGSRIKIGQIDIVIRTARG